MTRIFSNIELPNSNFCCIFQLKYRNFKKIFKKCVVLADCCMTASVSIKIYFNVFDLIECGLETTQSRDLVADCASVYRPNDHKFQPKYENESEYNKNSPFLECTTFCHHHVTLIRSSISQKLLYLQCSEQHLRTQWIRGNVSVETLCGRFSQGDNLSIAALCRLQSVSSDRPHFCFVFAGLVLGRRVYFSTHNLSSAGGFIYSIRGRIIRQNFDRLYGLCIFEISTARISRAAHLCEVHFIFVCAVQSGSEP